MVTVVAATTAAMNNVLSRPAKVGDKLVTHNFGTGTGGFADAAIVGRMEAGAAKVVVD